MFKFTLIICVFCLTSPLFGQNDFDAKRQKMVKEQLKARDIKDKPTLAAMSKVPRHEFVPDNLKSMAYDDRPLPIGEEQTISQPYMVAFMSQDLKLKSHHRVLEIGTGSGYQAAVLAEMVDSVFTIEIVEKLGIRARDRLKLLGYDNVEVKIGDGYHGWEEKAPFDAIIVTAGATKIPQPLLDQLTEGGSMSIPIGQTNQIRILKLVTKKNGRIKKTNRMFVRFVPFTRKED
jgi:protein-L-isoaspartate(D-aspartate) O-methyltransferase